MVKQPLANATPQVCSRPLCSLSTDRLRRRVVGSPRLLRGAAPAIRREITPRVAARKGASTGRASFEVQRVFLPVDAAKSTVSERGALVPGESLTDAIKRALEERLDRERARASSHGLTATVLLIQESVAKLPIRDPRLADELLGYDAAGLPG